jgi:predicted PurR-regulated permease PerM
VANNSSTAGIWQRALAVCGSLVLIVAALFWARVVLIPLVVAILFAFILTPVVQLLQRWGVHRVLAAILAVFLACAILCGLGAAVLVQAQSLAEDMAGRKDEIAQKVKSVRDWQKGSWLERVNFAYWEIAAQVREEENGQTDKSRAIRESQEPIPVRIETSRLPLFRSAVANGFELLISVGLILVLIVFILVQREDLRNRLLRLWGRENLTTMTKALDDGASRISRYLGMQLLVNTGFGVAVAAGLFFIGIPYPLLWGFLAGALRYIPYIGAWLGAIFPLAISLVFTDGWTQPILVAVLFTVLEISISYALEPLIYGHSIGVSGVALLLATVFWAWLWGPIGLLLSTPLTACLVLVGRYVPHMGFLTILLGDRPVLKPPLAYYQRLLARDQDEAIDQVEEYLKQHPIREVYEHILLPTLVLTKQNKARPDFTAEDGRFILLAIREMLDDLALLQSREKQRPGRNEVSPDDGDKVLVFGCPAADETDELALELFRQVLDSSRCQFEVIPSGTLAGEIVARLQQEKPALACVAVLPAEGYASARYLCKRLRAEAPDLQIVVGCWGLDDNVELTRERLISSGADQVGVSFEETRNQILALAQVVSQPDANSKPQPVGAGPR